MYRYIPVFLILLVLSFQIYVFTNKDKNDLSVVLADQTFQTEIVDSPSLMKKGLSGRSSLCQTCAMVFVFEKEGKYRFWMKDMKFPIDIIWLDKEGKIIYRRENLSPDTFPQTFGPEPDESNTLYVIEVPSGTYNKYGLYIGQKILFK